MEYKFYNVTNLVRPHCIRCNKNYKVGDTLTICNEFYGKGADRRQCNGLVLKDLHLDWSTNLVKDYSLLTRGDLSLWDEINGEVQKKLESAKIGQTAESGKVKVNVQLEYENFMRLRGVNIINKFNNMGELVSTSVYVLPAGKARVSEFGYSELRERFEQTTVGEGDKKVTQGFMIFEEEGVDKAEPIKVEVNNADELTCKVCGKTFKGKLGLIAHSRTHEPKK
jgi:hypothetical protein